MEGWVCPKCGRVWSPSVAGCGDCNQQRVTITLTPGSSATPLVPWGTITLRGDGGAIRVPPVTPGTRRRKPGSR